MAFRDIEIFESCMRDMESLSAFKMANKEHIKYPNGANKFSFNKNSQRMSTKRQRFNPLVDLNETIFRMKYRYSKENLRRIIEIVRDDLEVDHNNQQLKHKQVPVDLQIMAAIRFWGGTEHPEITASVHGITRHTLTKICKRVASALASKASRYIRMPATLSEKELVLRSFQDLAQMPQVIGTVTHASVRYKPKSAQKGNADEVAYEEGDLDMECEAVNIGEDYFIHLQVVCDAMHKIRDLDLRLSEEIDTTFEMFTQSRIKERFEQNEFRGRLLLGNEPLACTQFLYTPVQCPKNDAEELFNRMHAATFVPAVNCINLWYKRFGIMHSELFGSFGSMKQTITALALLHNMAMEWNDNSLGIDNNGIFCDGMLLNLLNLSSDLPLGDERSRRDFIKSNF